MRKSIKMILLFVFVFIGMNSVDAEECTFRAKSRGGQLTPTSVDLEPENFTSCEIGEYYYKVQLNKGKAPEITNYHICDYNGGGLPVWVTDNRMRIENIKYEDFLDAKGNFSCSTPKICEIKDDSEYRYVVTNDCEGKDPHKPVKPTPSDPTPSGPKVDNLCDGNSDTIKLAKEVYTLLRFIIPVLVIVLSAIDFFKVVINGDEKIYAEAWGKFVKRLIVGVVILLVPILVQVLLNLSNVTSTYGNEMFCIFK